MGLGEVRGSWREERRSRTRAASGEGSWRRSGRSCQRDGQQQRRQPVRSADARVESQSRARRTGRAGSSKEGAAASGRWEAADERARPGVSRELALVGPVPTDRPPPPTTIPSSSAAPTLVPPSSPSDERRHQGGREPAPAQGRGSGRSRRPRRPGPRQRRRRRRDRAQPAPDVGAGRLGQQWPDEVGQEQHRGEGSRRLFPLSSSRQEGLVRAWIRAGADSAGAFLALSRGLAATSDLGRPRGPLAAGVARRRLALVPHVPMAKQHADQRCPRRRPERAAAIRRGARGQGRARRRGARRVGRARPRLLREQARARQGRARDRRQGRPRRGREARARAHRLQERRLDGGGDDRA